MASDVHIRKDVHLIESGAPVPTVDWVDIAVPWVVCRVEGSGLATESEAMSGENAEEWLGKMVGTLGCGKPTNNNTWPHAAVHGTHEARIMTRLPRRRALHDAHRNRFYLFPSLSPAKPKTKYFPTAPQLHASGSVLTTYIKELAHGHRDAQHR